MDIKGKSSSDAERIRKRNSQIGTSFSGHLMWHSLCDSISVSPVHIFFLEKTYKNTLNLSHPYGNNSSKLFCLELLKTCSRGVCV